MDIEAWLRGLGLERYVEAFRDNEIDERVFPNLTPEDLKDLGVILVGHRRRLLDAIAALGAAASIPAKRPTPFDVPAAAEAERRQLTVIFCDLVGSTALATRHDPEDLREVIAAYHRTVADAVSHFDGFLAKYMGDGDLVYFGYPQAHEEDAERAVRAALSVIDAVSRLDTAEPLAVRLGIASGLVVVGDLIGEGAAQERGIVGETPNLAARLQTLAEPNTVVVADATRRQLGALFEVDDLGPQSLAGFAEPQQAWRVSGESGVISRFEALRSGSTPLIGRDEELELLLRRWRQAKGGEGRVTLISGEPGIGKSRLTAALSQRIENEQYTRLRYFCSPHHQDSAFYPFIAQLERAAGFTRDDTPEEKRAKLDGMLDAAARSEDELALIAELLSLPNAASNLKLSVARKREMLFEALLRQLEFIAVQGPVLMLFEDVHWIDPTSRELIDLTIERVRRSPILLLVTFRPEFHSPWADQPHVTMLTLNRLGETQGAALVEQLAREAVVSREVVAQIVDRTDGVPLFIEELTKAVLENLNEQYRVDQVLSAGTARLSVPPTLHASLIARLDRLGPAAKEIAQTGAVIGRAFGYELIERVSRRPGANLQASLTQLTDAGLLFCRGTPPHSSYVFKHALVQDAAYGTLLRNRRRELHASIARVLEEEFGEVVESRPELLAYHHAEAGQVHSAAAYWDLAARQSIARSAMAEAAAQLQKGLDQLRLLPDDQARKERELELLAMLGRVMQGTAGNASPKRGGVYARAREIWEELGYPARFLHVPYGQTLFHVYRGEVDVALRLGHDLLRLGQLHGNSRALILGHFSLSQNLTIAGRFMEARSHLDEVAGLCEQMSREELYSVAGMDPMTVSRSILANVMFCLGYPDQAMEHVNSAMAEAEALDLLRRGVGTLTFSCRLFSVSGDYAALRQRADQLLNLATEQRFPLWAAEARMYLGWADANNGATYDGIALLEQGAVEYRAAGHEAGMSHYISLLAQADAMVGRVDKALPLLDDALKVVESTGEHRFLAELYRYKGEFLFRTGKVEIAEALFRKSLDIARGQQAKMWELRAAISLGWLWAERGRRGQALELVAGVYSWFTEGFDTADLKAARALLAELA